MNVSTLLNWKRDEENYYTLLGCDRSANLEQIQTEFRVRARQLHPDKRPDCTSSNELEEKFKKLQQARSVLCDASKRRDYDKWLDSGMALSFSQWEAFKDAVHTSLHWASPALAGRMLPNRAQSNPQDKDIIIEQILRLEQRGEEGQPQQQQGQQQGQQTVQKSNEESGSSGEEQREGDAIEAVKTAIAKDNEDMTENCDPNDVFYSPRPYETFVSETGLHVETPPTELESAEEEESGPAALIRQESRTSLAFQGKQTHTTMTRRPSSSDTTVTRELSQREKQNVFALTRQDTGSEFVYGIVMKRIDPDDMRRKFRNYEI